MPSFDYYATFDESIHILSDLCEQGFRIVAYPGPLDTPEASIYDAINNELITILKEAPGFFVIGLFTRFPVQFQQLNFGDYQGKYIIDLHSEGPLIQSLLARVNKVDNRYTLLAGNFSYQDQYRNPQNEEWSKAGPEVKSAYRKLLAIVKKRCVEKKLNKKIYIGPEALKLLDSGKVDISCF